MDYEAARAAALTWYVQLATTPGWKGQAWHSANALVLAHPVVFGDLLDRMEEATGTSRPAAAVRKG